VRSPRAPPAASVSVSSTGDVTALRGSDARWSGGATRRMKRDGPDADTRTIRTAELDPTPGPARHRPGELVRPAATPATVMEVFTRAARQVRRRVRYGRGAWMRAEPVSGLPGAPRLLADRSAPVPGCAEHWRAGFVDADAVRFPPLARSASPATTLRACTRSGNAADPHWGARFRWCAHPLGFLDELRLVLRVDTTPWAMLTLWRHE